MVISAPPDRRNVTEEHLPTARNVHHVGLTVPDLDVAVAFFVDALGCEELYRKGPFGDPDGDSMARRLDVHPDATASLAMLRCGPTTNLELFEWNAPDRDETPTNNADVGGMHLALQVEDIDAAVSALSDRSDVTVLDGPHTNEDGPTAGLTYVYCRVEWGLYLELLEAPASMPYAEAADDRLYGPAPAWTHRPEQSE
ncbi:VOC family protein [Halocatena pleomorpha]|uniref:VOC family protein n=1 Tax=Halocatena pleomorpha TaxID=1785090 RepID=A0A3P3REB7_9EURY|nr:VOC family protein [Halocatena pleomorpha]RRJ30753.1 VOC family protein [Halocatena pleomorpha]